MSDFVDFKGLVVERDAGIALITLNQPEKRNVISDDPLMSELTKVFEILDVDENTRVIILTGSGLSFSAGGNIKTFSNFEVR